jgi:geranylgeranylglycerol-phosphate geranylgeranyltransferase
MKSEAFTMQAPPRHWAGMLRAALRLMRIEKPLFAGLLALLGAWLAAPLPVLWTAPVLTAAACVACITAFGFVINDCFDVAVDRIGKPGRPLPAGAVSLRAATALAWAWALAGLALGASLGPLPALWAAGAVALSAAYSMRLKSTLLLGNAAVALLVAGALVFGARAAGHVTASVLIAGAIAFSYIVAQEVLFNLEDEAQDRAAGLQTTATQLGRAYTASLVRVLLVVFAAVALAPWLAGAAPARYAAALAVVSLAPAALLWWWLRPPAGAVAVACAARWSRLLWLTSFVPLGLLK